MAFEKLKAFLGGKKEENTLMDNKNRMRPARIERLDRRYHPEHEKNVTHVEDRRAAYDEKLRRSSPEHMDKSKKAQAWAGERGGLEGVSATVTADRADKSARKALDEMKKKRKAQGR